MPVNGTTRTSSGSSTSSAAASRFIALLQQQMTRYGGQGFQETNGNNINPYAPEIGHANGLAWCATFVSWMLKKGGADPKLLGASGNGSAAVEGLAANYSKAGRLMRNNGSYRPQPGDAIFYGGSHIEIVQQVKGDKIYCIGGNTSNGVNGHWKDINDSSITHYGRTFGEKLPDAVQGTENLSNTSGTGSGSGVSGGGQVGNAPISTGVAPSGKLEDPLVPVAQNAWQDGTVVPYGMTLDELLEKLKENGIKAADFLKANPQFKGQKGSTKIPKGAKLTLPKGALKDAKKADGAKEKDGAKGVDGAKATGKPTEGEDSTAQTSAVDKMDVQTGGKDTSAPTLNPVRDQAPAPEGTPSVSASSFGVSVRV